MLKEEEPAREQLALCERMCENSSFFSNRGCR